MISTFTLFLGAQLFLVLLAVSLGRMVYIYRIRKEENRRKELELSIMEKRTQILAEGKKIAHNLEELLFNAQIQKEIDDMIRKN